MSNKSWNDSHHAEIKCSVDTQYTALLYMVYKSVCHQCHKMADLLQLPAHAINVAEHEILQCHTRTLTKNKKNNFRHRPQIRVESVPVAKDYMTAAAVRLVNQYVCVCWWWLCGWQSDVIQVQHQRLTSLMTCHRIAPISGRWVVMWAGDASTKNLHSRKKLNYYSATCLVLID